MLHDFLRRLLGTAPDAADMETGRPTTPIDHNTGRGFPVALQNPRPDTPPPYALGHMGAAPHSPRSTAPLPPRPPRHDIT